MIRRARRDGRQARGNVEKEKREDEKREPLFLQVLRVWQVGAQESKFGFFKPIECITKMSWCETQCKTRRSVEHCTPHADSAWLTEWLVTVVIIVAYLWSS